MAKNSPLEMIEQHVEKGVLVLMALLFLVVLARWGLSSPRRIEVISGPGARTEAASPSEADEFLRRAAADIRRMHEEADPEPDLQPDLADRIQRYRRPRLEDYYHDVTVAQPRRWVELPMLGHEEVQVTLASLTEAIPAPSNPRVNVDRVLPYRQDPQDPQGPQETWVSHVAAVYPWGELSNNWQQRLRGTRVPPRVVVLGVEAEVQQRGPDGQWADARTVQGVAAGGEDGRPGAVSWDVPDYDGTNVNQVRQTIERIVNAQRQSPRIIQPEYWHIYWPSTREWVPWRVNLPETPVSRMAEPADADVAAVDRRGDAAFRQVADQPDDADDTPTPTPVPPISTQIEGGNVLVWVHDESPQSRRAYRYRVRLRLLNPLYTWDGYVEDAEDAREQAVYTPFSDWSEPHEVDPDVRFFLIGSQPPQPDRGISGRLVVEVFSRSFGQVVRHRFTLSPGDSIGGTDTVEVMNPIEGEATEVEVNFTTGAVAVDFEFDREIEFLGRTRTTAELLYLDESGRMNSRILAADRDSEAYREQRSAAEAAEAADPADRPEQEPRRRDRWEEDFRRDRQREEDFDRRRMREQLQ